MFHSQIVQIGPNGREPRKISRSNLENLYAYLLNMVNISKAAYRSELVGLIGIVFNRILTLYRYNAVDMIHQVKLARSWYLSYIRGITLGKAGFSDEAWNYDHSCPALLEGVVQSVAAKVSAKKTLEEMLDFHRVMFALLSLDRVVVIPAKADYSTVVAKPKSYDPPAGADDNRVTNLDISNALKSMGMTKEAFKAQYRLACSNFEYEVLSSSGPNGAQTWSAYSDAQAWEANPELFKRFQSYLEESKLSFIVSDMKGTLHLKESDLLPGVTPVLGKLNTIEEWGGKARVVAALDYWSQMALTPLHNTINHFLKLNGCDGTFDQEAVIAKAKGWTGTKDKVVNCFDLTAATDSLPIDLQREVLSELFGAGSIPSCWRAILRDRDFQLPDGTKIRYGTGQPMGARSSFPMLALLHHVIIRVAASRNKLTNFVDYCVVGDDSTICNAEVARHYQLIMAAYHVKINLTKSVIHDPKALKAAEMCKRVFIEGHEISTIPVKTIAKTIRDSSHASELQNQLLSRNPTMDPKDFWLIFTSLLDKESLILHIKNNLMPTSVSGLVKAVKVDEFELNDYSQWFGTELTESDIVETYTWTVAVEGLKRLDALLRSSAAIFTLIMAKSGYHSGPEDDILLSSLAVGEVAKEAASGMPEAATKLRALPAVNSFHPITRAAESEARRLASDLHLLSSGDTTMVNRARTGLLDRFRNALTDVWIGRAALQPRQDRALIQKALVNLETMCRINANRKLDYNVVLAFVGRTWSISLEKGGMVLINSVRARVSTSITSLNINLTSALKGVSFINTSRKVKSTANEVTGTLSGDSPPVGSTLRKGS